MRPSRTPVSSASGTEAVDVLPCSCTVTITRSMGRSSRFAIAPIVLDWGANVGRSILLTPYALKFSDEAVNEWREHKWEAVGIAILIPLSYILVLTAMQFTPVSYVAPAREISILIGTAMGARLLAEGDARRRLAAASAMVLGIVGLTLG